jgi:hypothetical protein
VVTEPTLFPVEAVPPTLTERQQFVLEQLRNFGEDGLSADEVGALLCARRGRHDAGTRCEYDSSNGTGVLKALKKKGLARRRRGGTWLALSGPDGGGDSSSGASSGAESALGPGELPEGF